MYRNATDMRNGFDGLCGLVKNEFKMNPMSGDVFIFFSRRRDRIKLLHWQGDGFAIFQKRLEKGTYEVPVFNSEKNHFEISTQQLLLIMEGISLHSIKKRRRFSLTFSE